MSKKTFKSKFLMILTIIFILLAGTAFAGMSVNYPPGGDSDEDPGAASCAWWDVCYCSDFGPVHVCEDDACDYCPDSPEPEPPGPEPKPEPPEPGCQYDHDCPGSQCCHNGSCWSASSSVCSPPDPCAGVSCGWCQYCSGGSCHNYSTYTGYRCSAAGNSERGTCCSVGGSCKNWVLQANCDSGNHCDPAFGPFDSCSGNDKRRSKQCTAKGCSSTTGCYSSPYTVFDDQSCPYGCQDLGAIATCKPNASFTYIPNSGISPLTISFDAGKSSDPDGSIAEYKWTWPDGTTTTETNPETTHVFDTGGLFNAILVVTDNDGATSNPVTNPVEVKEVTYITELIAADPDSKKASLDFNSSCSRDGLTVQVIIEDEFGTNPPLDNGNPMNFTCNKSISMQSNQGFEEAGVYTLTANIMKNSVIDPDCSNCPKTVYFVVKQEVDEVKALEIHLLLVAGIAFAVLIAVHRK